MSKHTPTPWDNSGDGKKIVHFYDNHLHTIAEVSGQTEHGWARKANAAHIVKCVNLHDELIAVLRECRSFLISASYERTVTFAELERALAKARGEA